MAGTTSQQPHLVSMTRQCLQRPAPPCRCRHSTGEPDLVRGVVARPSQVASTMACQHQDQLVALEQRLYWEDRVKRFVFTNGSVLWVVINSHILRTYCSDWQLLLEDTLSTPLYSACGTIVHGLVVVT